MSIANIIRRYYFGPNHPFKLRIVYFLVKNLTERNKRVKVSYINKTYIWLDLREYIDSIIFFKKEYEKELFEKLMEYAEADEVLWDIGAHIGSFALKGLNNNKIKEIHCFEPNPETFNVLYKNWQSNNQPQKMVLHNIALGSEEETLYYLPNHSGNSGAGKITPIKNSGSIEVRAESIIKLLNKNNINFPTLVKIDVEGFELGIVKGIIEADTESKLKAIIVETERQNNYYSIVNLFNKANLNFTSQEVETQDEKGGLFGNYCFYRNKLS